MERLHALVEGRVQGVFFRSATREVAQTLELVGWVRNCRDGRVEVLAEGSSERLESLLRFLHQGPPHAQVTHVEVQRAPAQGDLGDEFFVAR